LFPLLGEKASTNPVALLNAGSRLSGAGESDSASSFIDPSIYNDSLSRQSDSVNVEHDPFIPGSPYRGKKRRVKDTAGAAVTKMLDALETKWKDDREIEVEIREEEKQSREQLLDVLTKGQQSMNEAVGILKYIAEKI
jgi:hypothetical protein